MLAVSASPASVALTATHGVSCSGFRIEHASQHSPERPARLSEHCPLGSTSKGFSRLGHFAGASCAPSLCSLGRGLPDRMLRLVGAFCGSDLALEVVVWVHRKKPQLLRPFLQTLESFCASLIKVRALCGMRRAGAFVGVSSLQGQTICPQLMSSLWDDKIR